MVLTQQERDKFATYLEETATDNALLAKQMEQVSPQLAQKLRVEGMSAQIVAKVLRETEGGAE